MGLGHTAPRRVWPDGADNAMLALCWSASLSPIRRKPWVAPSTKNVKLYHIEQLAKSHAWSYSEKHNTHFLWLWRARVMKKFLANSLLIKRLILWENHAGCMQEVTVWEGGGGYSNFLSTSPSGFFPLVPNIFYKQLRALTNDRLKKAL